MFSDCACQGDDHHILSLYLYQGLTRVGRQDEATCHKALFTWNVEALAQGCAGAGSVEHASDCAEDHPGPQAKHLSLSMPALPGLGAVLGSMLPAVLGPVHLLMVLRSTKWTT